MAHDPELGGARPGLRQRAVTLIDITVRGYRQPMKVRQWVWPLTGLYLGPAAVWAYSRWGRPNSHRWLQEHHRDAPPAKPRWGGTSVGVSHCGAGCTLGDIIAEFAIYGLGLTIAGQALYAEYIGDYILAAAKADILSLSAFEVGLFGWMAVQAFALFPAPHHLHPNSPVYWFGMQIGMITGSLTAYPVNAWLIRTGIKEVM